MWLIDFILEMELLGSIIFGSAFILLILAFILIIFGHIMHPFLSKRLDPSLFNERWFSLPELAMFSGWPLSLIKSGHYMFLITFPNFSRRRRFKDVPIDLGIPTIMIIGSRIFIMLHLIAFVVTLVFAISGFYGYFFYEDPPS